MTKGKPQIRLPKAPSGGEQAGMTPTGEGKPAPTSPPPKPSDSGPSSQPSGGEK
jgi:hypothetical protein